MTRSWHLEHADGHEWTEDELAEQFATESDIENGTYRFDVACAGNGQVYLLDNWGFWYYATEDVVVVCDG